MHRYVPCVGAGAADRARLPPGVDVRTSCGGFSAGRSDKRGGRNDEAQSRRQREWIRLPYVEKDVLERRRRGWGRRGTSRVDGTARRSGNASRWARASQAMYGVSETILILGGASWQGMFIAGSWTVGLDAPETDALLSPHLGRAIKQSWPRCGAGEGDIDHHIISSPCGSRGDGDVQTRHMMQYAARGREVAHSALALALAAGGGAAHDRPFAAGRASPATAASVRGRGARGCGYSSDGLRIVWDGRTEVIKVDGGCTAGAFVRAWAQVGSERRWPGELCWREGGYT
ncbi:hypothetical protein BD309DRAFT_486648 [Dichomitus squalens]|nr:hypothetical protein BD309DRAFT_486648 [Dichomitus squalens]